MKSFEFRYSRRKTIRPIIRPYRIFFLEVLCFLFWRFYVFFFGGFMLLDSLIFLFYLVSTIFCFIWFLPFFVLFGFYHFFVLFGFYHFYYHFCPFLAIHLPFFGIFRIWYLFNDGLCHPTCHFSCDGMDFVVPFCRFSQFISALPILGSFWGFKYISDTPGNWDS